MNLHNGHKILSVNDEEELRKENITIENSVNEFNENTKRIIELKNKIESEITEIDKSYEKVFKEVTKSFEIRQEKLIHEVNELKEKLQNEVTKIKEKLEDDLSYVNELIKNGEKMNKGIKTLEKEEKTMIKILSYVSKINKHQKEMENCIQKLMKNFKISFEEEKGCIIYEEYYFNGLPPPKDIEFKEINKTGVKILWKIDEDILKICNTIYHKFVPP